MAASPGVSLGRRAPSRLAIAEERVGGLARLKADVEKRLAANAVASQETEGALCDASAALGPAADRARENPTDHGAQMALGTLQARTQTLNAEVTRLSRARDALRVERDGAEDRLFEAQQQLEKARTAHDLEVAAALVEQERRAAERAKTAPAREKLLAELRGPAFGAKAEEDAKVIVTAVLTILDRLPVLQKSIQEDERLVTEYRSLDGDELPRRDGSAHAGALAKALYASGGTWSFADDQIHEFRFLFDPPSQGQSWNRFTKAREIVALITSSLETAERYAAAGVAGRGRATLALVADSFSSSRDRIEAGEKFAAHRNKDVAANAERAQKEHAARLGLKSGDSTPDAINKRLREESRVQLPRPVASAVAQVASVLARVAPPRSPARVVARGMRGPNDVEDEGENLFDTIG